MNSGLKSSLLGRLGLTEKKLKTLAIGLQQIAEKADVLGSFKSPKFILLFDYIFQDKLFDEHD